MPKVIQIISLSPWLVKEDTQPFGPCAQCVAQDGLLLVFCLLHAIIFPLHTRALSVNSFALCTQSLTDKAWELFLDNSSGSEGLVSSVNCVFCDIVRGAAPASVVYADSRVMAFMDIQPVNMGHLLVVPRVHASYLNELEEETGGWLLQVGMKLAGAMRRSGLRCEGVNLFLADGEAAGQEIFHVHLHVIPRFQGDGFGFRFAPEYYHLPERVELDEAAVDIRRALEE